MLYKFTITECIHLKLSGKQRLCQLAGSTVIGIGSRNEQDMYKVEIVRLVESMQDREALCKVYTFAKYVPQQY